MSGTNDPRRNQRGDATARPIEPTLIQRLVAGAKDILGFANHGAGTEVPQAAQPNPHGPQALAAAGSNVQTSADPYQGWFGPGPPLPPSAPAGDVAGRAFDYPSTYNIGTRPRRYEPISFEQLEALADSFDILRLCIETRKDQMGNLTWSCLPRTKANVELRSKPDARCEQFEAFMRRPDRRQSFHSWMRELIESQLVFDAPAIYIHRTVGGDIYSLDVVKGSTVSILLDKKGRAPEPPYAAFQQILKGLPAINYTTEEMIYWPRNRRPGHPYGQSPTQQVVMTVNIALRRELSKLAFFCYSDDTEVLTKRGWMRFAETQPGDEFATRQINTGIFEWQKAYDTFYKPYKGKMVHFTGQSTDILVTPNHRMLVNTLPAHLGRIYPKQEHVVEAEELIGINSANIGIPHTSVWEGVEVGDKVFPKLSPHGKPVSMSGDDYCAFMGMYLAEGNLRKEGGIAISQPPDDRGAHALYRDLLNHIFLNAVCYTGHQFEVCREALASHLRQFGKSYEKFIPEDILNATPRQLGIFWHYYYLGDGHAQGDNGNSSQVVFTTSRRLADHIAEVLQKMGSAVTSWYRSARESTVEGRTVQGREGWYITRSKRRTYTRNWTARYVDYEGPVACVCVPNKFLYVRRNGKACWSGNTEGNVPEALCSVPESWSPDQIARFQAMWDAMLADQSERRRMKFVPGGMNFQMTRDDAALMDTFDEWLARVICYAFSLPPMPFVRMVNRATAQTSYDAALEEGLQPMMTWFKGLMDHIIQVVFGFDDLELVWDDFRQIDPAEQEQRDLQLVQVGIKSIDEVRIKMGLTPLGMPNAIFGGPNGVIFLDDLIKAHKQGLLMPGQQFAPPDATGGGMFAPPQQAQPGAPGGFAHPFNPQAAAALGRIPPALLAAVGLGAQGPRGRVVDITADEETASDPLSNVVAHPAILKTLRDAERSQGRG